MSDTLDRPGVFDGGNHGHSCEYPAPHSGVAPVVDGHDNDNETASISALSDDCMQLFDWDRFESDQATDVTTPTSDVPSEGRPAAARVVPAQAPPAAPAADHEDDCPMPDAPSPQEPHVPHVWPEVSGPHPPRPFHLEASPSPPPSTAMHLDGQSQAVSSPSAPRKTRVVQNPVETSQVRDAGACYPCKMSKSKCNAELVCEKCSKRPMSSSICIRRSLQDMVPSTFFRWSWNDPNFLMPSREQFTDDRPSRLFVSISDSVESPTLELEVGRFALPNQKGPGLPGGFRWCIAPGRSPSEDIIYRWMEEQIEADTRADFEAEMDKLLLELVRQQEEAMPLPGQRAGSLHRAAHVPERLLSNLLKMRCMWKVWSCKQLFVRQQGCAAVPFDLRLAPVQDFLQCLAARRISELERQVLRELDKYLLFKKEKKDTPPEVGIAMDVMKWLLSWQMMLIYRQSLGWILDQQQQTDAAPVFPMNGERHTMHTFRETTRQLFEGCIVIYSGLFHKKTTIERTRAAGPQIFEDDCLYRAYQRACEALPEFYQQVLRQMSPTDELFVECIVTKESEILAKARRTRK